MACYSLLALESLFCVLEQFELSVRAPRGRAKAIISVEGKLERVRLEQIESDGSAPLFCCLLQTQARNKRRLSLN